MIAWLLAAVVMIFLGAAVGLPVLLVLFFGTFVALAVWIVLCAIAGFKRGMWKYGR